MTYEQLITPNPNIWCRPGWCLEYVRSAFGLPIVEPTATKGWENADSKHRDYDFPDAWVPLWFSIDEIPEGHVVLRAPDGRIYSTSTNANTAYVHPNLEHLIWFYGPRVQPEYQLHLRYLGWSEDISNVSVVQNITITPESIGEDEMSAAEVQEIKEFIQAAEDVTRGYIIDEVTKRVNQFTQDASDVTRGYLADKVKEADGAQQIVDMVPESLVDAVAKGLAERLSK